MHQLFEIIWTLLCCSFGIYHLEFIICKSLDRISIYSMYSCVRVSLRQQKGKADLEFV